MKSVHPDSWGLKSGQRMPAEPKVQPFGAVNTHPGSQGKKPSSLLSKLCFTASTMVRWS